MTEQNDLSISELQQQANADNLQAKRAIYSEIEKKRGQHLDIKTLLQLIKQQACEFSKDEILEIIFSDRFGLGREMGQFFTPSKIAELISVIAGIYNPKSVIDICCGTGNLLSYFKNLQTVKGIDINSEIVELAQYINPNAVIVATDTLKLPVDTDGQKSLFDQGIKYDLVVGALPLGARTADKKPLEIELIKKGLALLNNNGVAIFLVPENLLTNSASTEFRHELLSNFALDMVISLPAGILPFTFIKTSVLVFRNGKKNQDVYMPEFKNNSIELADNFKQHKGDFYVPVEKITDRFDGNYYLSLEAVEEIIKGHPLKKLSDMAEIIGGRHLDKNSFITKGKYFCFNRKDRDGNNFVDSIDERCILKSDDIVVSLIGPNNKIHLYKDDGIQTIITQNYGIIRPTGKDRYISIYLQTEDGINLLKQQISRHLVGSVMPHLTLRSLSNIDIPVLPLSELNEIVSKSVDLSNKTKFYLLKSSECLNNKDYNSARAYIEQAFEHADSEANEHKDIYLQNIDRAEELEEKNKILESEIKEKEALYKALHEKEKEMLSFFTHTLRNALTTAPESLRQAIHLLGGEVYEKDTKHYQAINKIAALFSTLSLTDCLIDTFKQSISDPQEFRQSWQNDHTGEATPKWVIASALRQALNRIIFFPDTTELRKLLNNPETALIKATRKSFIEEVLPLNVDSHGVEVFYGWTLAHIPAVEVSIADSDTLNFGVNQTRFSLLFAIMSELILNALKYWDGENCIQISWQLAEQGNYVFSVKNHCLANASSNLAGTHKGLAFIKRLVELLGEQAQFVCKSEGQLFTAELILTKALFDGES